MLFLLSSLGVASTLTVGGNGTYSTIQAAIAASSSGDEISVQSGTYTECLSVSHSLSFTGSGVTLNNNGCTDASLIISAGTVSVSDWSFSSSGARAIKISGSSTSLTLNNVEIDGAGSGILDGGAISMTGSTLNIVGGTFENNTGEKGGLIYASGGNISLSGASFVNNTADAQGGVIYGTTSVDVTITDSTFDSNSVGSYGGTIALIFGGSINVSNSSFVNGSADSKGGVFHIDHGQSTAGRSELTIIDSSFSNNSTGTSGRGGVAYVKDRTDISISGSSFENNSANKGGAFFLQGIGSDMEIGSSSFHQNSTALGGEGGAIAGIANGANNPVGIVVVSSSFTDNSADSFGGAIAIGGPYTNTQYGGAQISGSVFSGNTSVNSQSAAGGAVYVSTSSSYDVEVVTSIFEDNSSSISGGGLYVYGAGDVNISLVKFLSNAATGSGGTYSRFGGGLMLDNITTAQIGNSLFGGNSVTHSISSLIGMGGGMYVQSTENVDVFNTIFDENTSTDQGGAFASDTCTSVSIHNNHFLSNSATDGGGLYLASTATTVKNNIFAYHTGAAIYTADSTSSVSPSYNDWYQNSSNAGGNASFSTTTSGNISANPTLSGYSANGVFTDDYSLASASLLIDAGDPTILDSDGSTSDIGAFGGGNLLDSDGDGFSGILDCDDLNAQTHPGAAENETNSSACMKDSDGDGYGDSDVIGDIVAGTDCDDSAALVSPAAAEVCDGADNNCNGQIDENTVNGTVWYQDLDGDGYGNESNPQYFCSDPEGYTSTGGDCDDLNANTYPGATEIAGDGIDQNCDGGEDCYRDVDGDGYGGTQTASGFDMDCDDFNEAASSGDCDDADPKTHPGAAENDSSTACMKDSDEDGYGDAYATGDIVGGNDCNDDNATAYFGATEIVGDGVDQDCDFAEICYEDLDGDGYGTEQTVPSSDVDCTDAGESGTFDDCDGSDPQSYPGATDELGDGIDQNCDGVDGVSEAEPATEPSSPTTEPSGEPSNPSTEPSGEEVPNKSSCTHVSAQTTQGLFAIFLALLGLASRRRV